MSPGPTKRLANNAAIRSTRPRAPRFLPGELNLSLANSGRGGAQQVYVVALTNQFFSVAQSHAAPSVNPMRKGVCGVCVCVGVLVLVVGMVGAQVGTAIVPFACARKSSAKRLAVQRL